MHDPDQVHTRPARPPAISFCTSCKNRLWQLRETLPQNLAALEAHPDTELVVVDYDSTDGLEDWLRAFAVANPSPQLRFVKLQESRYWHFSIAKNLAHRLARGRWLVSLDADNFIGDQLPILRRFWSSEPDAVLHLWSGVWLDGTCGRIAMPSHAFRELGGYDEQLLPAGHQDLDLLRRARMLRMPVHQLSWARSTAMRNSVSDKIMEVAPTDLPWRMMERRNAQTSKLNALAGRWRANPSGHLPARVRLDFDGPELNLL